MDVVDLSAALILGGVVENSKTQNREAFAQGQGPLEKPFV